MSLSEIKSAARKAGFARRKDAFAAEGADQTAILARVLADHFGTPMAGYMPIRTEIDPLPAMTQAAKHGPVGVPVIQGDGQPLLFSRWYPGASLKDGPFGAKIPETDDFFEPEILIVPLVAFTKHGDRLGYGGGFYDRTLEALRAKRPTLAIGFAFDAQETESLPIEPTDQPLDMIVTDTGARALTKGLSVGTAKS